MYLLGILNNLRATVTDSNHNYATLSFSSDESDERSFLYTFHCQPTIPLSATIMYKASLKLTTLQQASLKHQLVGLPIVFDQGKLSTMVNIDFQNQLIHLRLAALSSRAKEARIYKIFPSTIITLIWDGVEEAPPPLPLSLSPTAQLLVESASHLNLRFIPRSFLLTGPPGVGKTFAVKQAHAFLGGTLHVIQGSELLGVTGHAADASIRLKELFHDCAATDGISWILLDECEALLSSDVVASMMGYLLDQLESTTIILVAATNLIDAVPVYLRRRMDREIALEPPNATERLSLLNEILRYDQVSQLEDIATACVGYVPADLIALVRHARFLSQNGQVVAFHLYDAMTHVPASALRQSAAAVAYTTNTTWDDIHGDPGGAKTTLRRAIEWPRRTAFRQMGLAPPRGILLHGPPGCAKTSLARAAAGASGMAFVSLSPADVYSSSYVGEAEAVVRRAFTVARSAAPCILFFDEIDSILGSGGAINRRSGTSAEGRVLSTFLNEMDGVDARATDGVLVLGATNRPSQLDAALLRPGRFDNIIYVPPPDKEGRRAIIDMFCQKWQCTDMDLEKLCSREVSGMMTGAEVVGACHEAAMIVLKERILHQGKEVATVTQFHLETALRACKPVLSDPTVLEEYTRFERSRTR